MLTSGMTRVDSSRFVPGAFFFSVFAVRVGSCLNASACRTVRVTRVGNWSACHACRDPCASLWFCFVFACHACRVSCVSHVSAWQHFGMSCVSHAMRVWTGCGSIHVRVKFVRVCSSCMFFCASSLFLRDDVPFGRESGETGGNMITVVLITHMLWGLIMHAAHCNKLQLRSLQDPGCHSLCSDCDICLVLYHFS